MGDASLINKYHYSISTV